MQAERYLAKASNETLSKGAFAGDGHVNVYILPGASRIRACLRDPSCLPAGMLFRERGK